MIGEQPSISRDCLVDQRCKPGKQAFFFNAAKVIGWQDDHSAKTQIEGCPGYLDRFVEAGCTGASQQLKIRVSFADFKRCLVDGQALVQAK